MNAVTEEQMRRFNSLVQKGIITNQNLQEFLNTVGGVINSSTVPVEKIIEVRRFQLELRHEPSYEEMIKSFPFDSVSKHILEVIQGVAPCKINNPTPCIVEVKFNKTISKYLAKSTLRASPFGLCRLEHLLSVAHHIKDIGWDSRMIFVPHPLNYRGWYEVWPCIDCYGDVFRLRLFTSSEIKTTNSVLLLA